MTEPASPVTAPASAAFAAACAGPAAIHSATHSDISFTGRLFMASLRLDECSKTIGHVNSIRPGWCTVGEVGDRWYGCGIHVVVLIEQVVRPGVDGPAPAAGGVLESNSRVSETQGIALSERGVINIKPHRTSADPL